MAQHRVRTLVNRFCKPVDIKLVFSTFKIKNLFNVKDPLPDRLRTRVVVGKCRFWDIDLGKFPKLGQFFCTEFSRKIKK